MDHSLSVPEIAMIAGRPFNTFIFKDIKKLDNIMDLFDMKDGRGSCLILYRNGEHYGHWCAMNCRQKKADKYDIDFFDSFGGPIDTAPRLLPAKVKEELEETSSYIMNLINKSDMRKINYHYNHIRLQDYSACTCGRYCGYFIKNVDVPVEAFAEILSKHYGMSPDKIIVAITEPMISIKIGTFN